MALNFNMGADGLGTFSGLGTNFLGAAGGAGGLLSGIGSIVGGPFGSAVGSLLGGLLGNQQLEKGMDFIEQQTEFNPFQGVVGGAGTFGPGGFQLDPALAGAQTVLGNAIPGLLSGAAPGVSDALAASQGQLPAAFAQANQALGQQASPFFNQGAFNANLGNIGQLGNIFANAAAQGPVDLSGGAQAGLFGGGLSALAGAGDQSGLIQQNLDASRALAAPQEQQLINQFADREFMTTRGATSGAERRQGQLADALLRADQQRVLDAQGLGLQAQQAQQQLGLGSIGAATGLLGQNLAGQQQNIGAAQGFGQLGLAGEGQGFDQMLRSLSQNQTAGTQRVSNALNLFNQLTGATQGAQGLGLQGIGQLIGLGDLGLTGQLGILNAEANRIGATGLSNQAYAKLASESGGLLGGLF